MERRSPDRKKRRRERRKTRPCEPVGGVNALLTILRKAFLKPAGGCVAPLEDHRDA